MKPRERYLKKKNVEQEAYRHRLANTYISRYNDMSYEAADFYKQRAIDLYVTE